MLTIIKNSLWRLKQKNILIAIQFLVGFFSLFLSVSIIDETYKVREEALSLIPGSSWQADCNEEEIVLNETQEKEKIQSVRKAMKKIKKAYDMDIFMFDALFFEDEGNGLTGIMLHEDAANYMNFDLLAGNIEPILNYDGGKKVPVVVSKEMAEVYPLGSEFSYLETGGSIEKNDYETFWVVGIAAETTSYFSGNCSFILDTLVQTTGMVFFTPEIHRSSNILSYENNIVYIPKSSNSNTVEKEKIEKIYLENNLDVEILSIEEQLQQYYDGKKMMIFVATFFSLVLLLLTSLGCMGTILASILMRKEEFGIYIALGFTKRKLYGLIAGELLSICIVSLLFAFGIFVLVKEQFNFIYADTMNWRVIAVGVITSLACLLLSLSIPLNKLKTLSILDMMEER